jgi:hypothetical protein
MEKIIIVGNGNNITKEKKGKIIDSFDIVIRCNSFQIVGYEEYTGIKTDILTIISSGAGCKAFNNSFSKDIIYDIKELWFSRPKNLCDKHHNNTLRHKSSNNQIKRYPSPHLFQNLCKKCRDIQPEDKKPSTGMVAIEMALDIFKDSDIYITGFDNFQTNHYYNTQKKIGGSHPKVAEKQIIENYIKENKIYLL